jgi:trigger factor
MQVAAEKLSPVLLELAVTVDAERVGAELTKAYKKLARTARVRGFRPGKAPRRVLSQVYGARISRDVAQQLVEETYQKALEGQNVQAVSQPAIETQVIKENAAFEYKARVEIVPEIEAVQYEGFEVQALGTEVTDELLDAELEQLRRANSTLEPPQPARGAKAGDVVTVDFDVVVDGEAIPEAGSQDYSAELGAGQILPEIEKALLDAEVGAKPEVQVPMPDAHPHPKLKGKEATFALTLKDIKERVLPELDDEFAKDLEEYETLDQLKEALKEDLKKRLEERAENATAELLVQKLVEANPIQVPPALVAQQTRLTEQQTLAEARAQGQQVQGLPPEVRMRIHQDSEMKVRAGLLMAEIAKQESIKIGDAEVEEGLKELAQQTGKNIAKLRAEYRPPKQREMLIGMILENKVLDIIQSKSKILPAK